MKQSRTSRKEFGSMMKQAHSVGEAFVWLSTDALTPLPSSEKAVVVGSWRDKSRMTGDFMSVLKAGELKLYVLDLRKVISSSVRQTTFDFLIEVPFCSPSSKVKSTVLRSTTMAPPSTIT